ncbi:LysR family transcriptional regulator [Pseudoduganella sp. RAF53_2]|uniref:LysR family transcriptional regulator n=1 Tax=Pseudoduganella sp. RAF53_2 TaxID=3233060 RepID=UPI003F9D7D13
MKQDYTIPRGALDGVEAFVRVAERRSFRQAAADLDITPSAISQAVRALEARVGVALFTRTTRSVGLTEAGQRFLEQARPAFDAIVSATAAARELGAKPSGLLRLTVPRSVVQIILQPVLASFSARYPDVVVEVVASEELADLARDGFDAGIRMGEFIDPDMVALRLTPPLRLAMLASPDYLARCGHPATPADLANHSCVRIRRSNGTVAPWRVLEADGPHDLAVTGSMIVNDMPTMLSAALGGAGLAQLPAPLAAEQLASGLLVEVLADYAASSPGLFIYFPSRAQVMPKLRAFIDHMKAYAQEALLN